MNFSINVILIAQRLVETYHNIKQNEYVYVKYNLAPALLHLSKQTDHFKYSTFIC